MTSPTLTSNTPPLTHVAVGIVYDSQGNVLFAQRPDGKPYAGWWEFPGGKLEAGETVALALARELREELDIQILDIHSWLHQHYVYPHATVMLHMCNVYNFTGQPKSLEKQAFQWGNPAIPPEPFLPAALPVLKALQLPNILRFTAATELGFNIWEGSLNRLHTGTVIVHEPHATLFEVERVLTACLIWQQAMPTLRRVLISSAHPQRLWQQCNGVHLTEPDLLAATERPNYEWVSAEITQINPNALAHATALNCNFVTLDFDANDCGWGVLGDALAATGIATFIRLLESPTQNSSKNSLETSLPLAQAAGALGIAAKTVAWK